jgi:hypothetical protein
MCTVDPRLHCTSSRACMKRPIILLVWLNPNLLLSVQIMFWREVRAHHLKVCYTACLILCCCVQSHPLLHVCFNNKHSYCGCDIELFIVSLASSLLLTIVFKCRRCVSWQSQIPRGVPFQAPWHQVFIRSSVFGHNAFRQPLTGKHERRIVCFDWERFCHGVGTA